ncbi:hypothetical protein CYR52_17540 [Chimaeribacter arupi]|nr:hypothetical protein CYR52_17540 [Chimaeribacter arupi]
MFFYKKGTSAAKKPNGLPGCFSFININVLNDFLTVLRCGVMSTAFFSPAFLPDRIKTALPLRQKS